MRASVDSRWGHGLKIVAVYGAGFEWRDDDPGGLQSQLWYQQALSRDATARDRILAYNADDVSATEALRAWLRDPQISTPANTTLGA